MYKFYSGDECFKTERITKDKKVFGMYRSMVIGEGEKIKSIPLKHILYFVGMVVVAGFIFKFGFMNILYRMNKKPAQGSQQEIMKSILPDTIKTFEDLKDDHMYDIVGTVGDQYIVKTDKGLKRVKIKASDNKRIGDKIKIEEL